MRHHFYSVTCSVAPINSSLLTITLHSSVTKTLVYNDTKYHSFRKGTTDFDYIYYYMLL